MPFFHPIMTTARWLAVPVFVAIGCSTPIGSGGAGLNQVNDWAYQLENLDSEELAASAFDLLVIDYSADGGESGEWTAGEIVLTVDYCNEQANIAYAYERSGGRGYVPYYTVVELDELRINPGHEPD